MEFEVADAKILYPAVACWPLDNQGASAHLCLAISNRSRHKCRKCLIQNDGIRLPGAVGERRDFCHDNALAKRSQQLLHKKWKGEEALSELEKATLRQCTYLNILKTPLLYMAKQRCSDSNNPYLSCPYDDLHTLSEGLLKGWVVWTVICVAAVAELDKEKYDIDLHLLDSKLMGFPSVMIPEILRRHRFSQVSNIVSFESMRKFRFLTTLLILVRV